MSIDTRIPPLPYSALYPNNMSANNYKSIELPNNWWDIGDSQSLTATALTFISNSSTTLMSSNINSTIVDPKSKEDENMLLASSKPVYVLILMFMIMLTAILGNLLVILSVIRVRKLRNQTNCFIVSLAVADIMVAMSAMSFNFSVQLAGRWLFSPFLCNLWNSLDVYFSTSSIIHLCCISVDRYWAICKPLKYPLFMTKRVVCMMLCMTWLSPGLISFAPIFSGIYTTESHQNKIVNHTEICEFVVNDSYAIVSSSVSFWIPASIMICTYFAIFREANRQERALVQRQGNAILLQRQSPVEAHGEALNGSSRTLNRNDDEHTPTKDRRNQIKREYKAAKTLGIIMGVFILCWLPFFLWYVSTTLCGDVVCPCPEWVVVTLFWIGYFNSTLNPFIYAYFNREFRDAFRSTLGWIFCNLCCDTQRRDSLRTNNRRKSADNYLKPTENRRAKIDNL